jgi:hypothetical protein
MVSGCVASCHVWDSPLSQSDVEWLYAGSSSSLFASCFTLHFKFHIWFMIAVALVSLHFERVSIIFPLTRLISDGPNSFRLHRLFQPKRWCRPHHFHAICNQKLECSAWRKQTIRCYISRHATVQLHTLVILNATLTRGAVHSIPWRFSHGQQRDKRALRLYRQYRNVYKHAYRCAVRALSLSSLIY